MIKDQPGDSYYVRAMFDRLPDPQAGPHQLSFRKDDILFIDNTMYNGVPGHWSAWLVDLGKQNLYCISQKVSCDVRSYMCRDGGTGQTGQAAVWPGFPNP